MAGRAKSASRWFPRHATIPQPFGSRFGVGCRSAAVHGKTLGVQEPLGAWNRIQEATVHPSHKARIGLPGYHAFGPFRAHHGTGTGRAASPVLRPNFMQISKRVDIGDRFRPLQAARRSHRAPPVGGGGGGGPAQPRIHAASGCRRGAAAPRRGKAAASRPRPPGQPRAHRLSLVASLALPRRRGRDHHPPPPVTTAPCCRRCRRWQPIAGAASWPRRAPVPVGGCGRSGCG